MPYKTFKRIQLTLVDVIVSILVVPGLYLREVRERSLTGDSVDALLCQFLTIQENFSLSISTVVYMGGDSCVNSTTDSILVMETLEATVTQVAPTNITIPLTDDTRSDILGAFDLDPTDDTSQR